MSEHERASQQKQDKVDQKHHVMQKESQPLFGRFHAWEQGIVSVTETPFSPRMDEHAELLAGAPSGEHRANLLIHLQQTYGNRYVQRVLEDVEKDEAEGAGPEPEPAILKAPTAWTPQPRVEGVQVILRPGYAPQTIRHAAPAAPSAGNRKAHDIVAPGGTPNVTEPGPDNTCLPGDITPASLDWEVVSDGLKWKPKVTSLTLTGQINIKPWPSVPDDDTVAPNTANPVLGGNLNNDDQSNNYWGRAVSDMETYDTAGGGAGPYWHCTEASRAHEWEHWNEDWLADCVNSSKGGDWPAVNAKIERLWVSKVLGRFTKDAGRKALEPLVNKQIDELDDKATDRWNDLDPADKPGAGGVGYAAGAKVLQPLINKVKSFGPFLQLIEALKAIRARVLGVSNVD